MQKIIINNQDTKYTIDQYQTFSDDSFVDSELDALDLTYDDVNIEYDLETINQAFANKSIDLIKELLPDNSIIKDIQIIKTFRPKYYNYQTDSYNMGITYNKQALDNFIKENQPAFDQYARRNTMLENEKEEYSMMFFLDSFYHNDTYIYTMHDASYEIYSENVTITTKKA